MGKKSGDSAAAKEKKARKQEELSRALAAQQALKSMEKSTPDLLAGLPTFRTFTRPAAGVDLTLLCAASPADLPAPTSAALFELTSQNMAPIYAASGFGWDPAAKARELKDEGARFLLAYETKDVVVVGEDAGQPGTSSSPQPPLPPTALPVAFVHYRLEMEVGAATLYVYEIQLAEPVRRLGLGKFLMCGLELAARKGGLAQIMLTVQAGNGGAEGLYEGLGFGTDPSSPEGEGVGYRIMSKQLVGGGGGGGGGGDAKAAVEVVGGGVKGGAGGVRAALV